MGRYQKVPVVIEAVQWPLDESEYPYWLFEAVKNGTIVISEGLFKSKVLIKTLEGDHICNHGDWIIRGVEGELYPCKPGIFQKTYEPAEGESIPPMDVLEKIRSSRNLVANCLPDCREKSLAMTKLEEAEMWLGKAILNTSEEC